MNMADLQRLVKLRSATGEIFEVDEEAVAAQSQFLANVFQDVGVESPIPLPNVSTRTLGQVLDYCKWYAKNDHVKRNVNLVEAVQDFNEVAMENLHGLIMAANYMHIESLLELICHTLARMIAKKAFGEIRQIFNFNNEFGRAKVCSIGDKSQLLASLMESLPTELQLKIKMKVGQGFHYEWSPWRYDVEAQVLVVDLAKLFDPLNMHHKIAIILLHIEIGLVRTLVLQTSGVLSYLPQESGRMHLEFVDSTNEIFFKNLFDGIDRLKVESVIFEEGSLKPSCSLTF